MGPFEFVDGVKDDHLTTPRATGARSGPYLDQIRYRLIPMTRRPEPDWRDRLHKMSARDVAAVKANSSVIEIDIPSLAAFGYQLNMTRRRSTTKGPLGGGARYHNEAITKDLARVGSGECPDRRLLGVRQLDPADQQRRGEGETVPEAASRTAPFTMRRPDR
jgi:hypothetical protein